MLASRGLHDFAKCARLVPGAILLLVEGLAVERARGGGYAGQDGECEKSGQKRLHDHCPLFCRFNLLRVVARASAIWCFLQLRKDVITHP